MMLNRILKRLVKRCKPVTYIVNQVADRQKMESTTSPDCSRIDSFQASVKVARSAREAELRVILVLVT